MELRIRRACRKSGRPGRYAVRSSVFWCVLGWLAAGCAQGETLRQVVETTVTTHPRVLAADAQRRAIAHEVSQARGGYLPTLDLNLAGGRERTDSPQSRVLGTDSETLGRRESGIVLSQKLFDGMATSSEVERQTARLNVATSRLAETREEIAIKAIEAYLEVLKNRQLVRLATENTQAHFEIRDRVRLRVEGGVSQRADIQQAQARVALAGGALSQRAGRLREVEANYVALVGKAPGELIEPHAVAARMASSGVINNAVLAETLREASATAAATNPSLSAANAEIAAAEASVRGAKAAYFPRLNLELSSNRNENIAGIRGNSDNDALMFVLRWNLFRGGSDRAQERAFAERRYAAIDAAADTRRSVEERVALALYAKSTSEERLAYLQAHASLSAEVLESYKQQLDLGRRTLLDVLNAENELFTARSNLAAARYDDLLSHYAIEAAKGTLVKSFGVTPIE